MESADAKPPVCKCEYCRGKNGKKKDIYETFQRAFDAAEHIRGDRGIFLNVYPCPHGKGWHLTKNNAPSGLNDRRELLFQNNNIPLSSPDGSWEYVTDDASEDENNDAPRGKAGTTGKGKAQAPIVRMECGGETAAQEISGKIMELIKGVDIGKIFKINVENVFCASMAKDILDDTVSQITVHVKNTESCRLESYTILIKDRLLRSKKLRKGSAIQLSILEKSINGISVWFCDQAPDPLRP
jgi:hypothetical protein